MKKYKETLIELAITIFVALILIGAGKYFNLPDLFTGILTGILTNSLYFEFKNDKDEQE